MRFAARIPHYRSMTLMIVLVGISAVGLIQRSAEAQTSVHVFWPAPSKATFQDLDREGLRLGDRLAARGPLLDASQTSRVGRGYLECVVMIEISDDPVEGPGGLYRCTSVLRLADGDITIGGLDPHGPGVYTFAVLGGTGAYADATGEATLTDTSSGADIVIDLR